MKTSNLINEIKRLMEEEEVSPEVIARYIGCSGRQVRRWIEGEARPTYRSRRKIRNGLEEFRKNLY